MLDPRVLIVLTHLLAFADARHLEVTVTSITSGREHLATVSQTHAEHRAIDIRSRGWPEKTKLELVAYLNKVVGHYGAIGYVSGKRRVIIYEKYAAAGEHFHIQVSRIVKPKNLKSGLHDLATLVNSNSRKLKE